MALKTAVVMHIIITSTSRSKHLRNEATVSQSDRRVANRIAVSANIKCQSLKVEICLNIPIIYEYHRQFLEHIKATGDSITISDAFNRKKNFNNKICKMNDYKISYEKNMANLCSLFETNTESSDTCGISSGNYLNINFFGLYMRVWNQPFFMDLANDYLFDLTCKTNYDQDEFVNGQIIDRSWRGTGKAIIPEAYFDLESLIDISIANSETFIKNQIMALQDIQIKFVFFKEKDDLAYFAIEQCSEIINNLPKIIFQRIDYKENRKNRITFETQIMSNNENSRDKQIKVVSSKFIAPNISMLTDVVYSCVIKFCEDASWCSQIENIESKESILFHKSMKQVNVKFITKKLQIQVFSSKTNKKFVTLKTDNQFCQIGSICLNQNQLIILSILTGIFFVLVIIVLTIIILKRSMAQLTNPNTTNQLHQMNFMDISLLPLVDISQQEDDPSLGKITKKFPVINPFRETLYTTRSANMVKNSIYLQDIGPLFVNEPKTQLLQLSKHNTPLEIIDNKYIKTFHFQSPQASVENDSVEIFHEIISSQTETQPQTSLVNVSKSSERIPLLSSFGEPGSSQMASKHISSTLKHTTQCECQTLPNNVDL